MTARERFAALRIKLEWTQDDMASAIGCAPSYVSKLELGTRIPTIPIAVRIWRLSKDVPRCLVRIESWVEDNAGAPALHAPVEVPPVAEVEPT